MTSGDCANLYNTSVAFDPSGKVATKREVRFGRRNPNSIEVLGGLLEGDEVIISSYANFIEVERLLIDD